MILDRPAFYDVLLKKIPKAKIHYGKRVESVEQDEKSATVHCADGRYGCFNSESLVHKLHFSLLRLEPSVRAHIAFTPWPCS